MYNAECDALDPKSVDQIRNDLRQMEKSWIKKPQANLFNEEDFDASAAEYRIPNLYLDDHHLGKRNSDHFRELVKTLKDNKKQAHNGA